MSGHFLQQLLIVEYVVIAAAYGLEGNWPKCGYFVSAGLITISVLFMK